MFKILREIQFDIIIIIILLNICMYIIDCFYSLEDCEFSIEKGNLINIYISFFRHSNYLHLLGNMITFYSFSKDLYDYRNGFIKSWKVFLIIYFLSGLFGFYFEILVYNMLNLQWKNEIESIADNFDCNFVLCKFMKSGAGLAYSILNYKKVLALNTIKKVKIIGAESCIYGIIGATLIYKTISKDNFLKFSSDTFKKIINNYKKKEYYNFLFEIALYVYNAFGFLTLIFDLMSKFSNVPWNINYLLNKIISNKIIHNSHVGGAIAGMIITLIYYKFIKSKF